MKNPISPETRAKIYLAGEIVADVVIVVGTILTLTGYTDAETIATVVAALFTRVISKLARANVNVEEPAPVVEAKPEVKEDTPEVQQDLQFIQSTRVPRHRADGPPIG